MTLARRLFPPLFLLAFASLACGEPAPYLRTAKGKEGGRVLEVAVRTLASPKRTDRVTLFGLTPVMPCEKVQKKLDAADLVLFEGVGFGDDGPLKRDEAVPVSVIQVYRPLHGAGLSLKPSATTALISATATFRLRLC